MSSALRSKEGGHSTGEAGDKAKFQGLLDALSFTHGKNAWPYRVKYWCGSALSDTITAVRDLPRTPHFPFCGLKRNVELAPLIEKIAVEFGTPSALSEKLTYLLFLFRQAGDKGVHHEIGALAVCSLFESLVRTLFDHFDLKEQTLSTMSLPEFSADKGKFLAHLETWPEDQRGTSYRRLMGMIRDASPLTMREKMAAVCLHLGLVWEDNMDKVFFAWKVARNPLAHGSFGEGSETSYKKSTIAESQIAGGFNTILLKFFGYSGIYNASVFEPGFQKM